MSGPGHDWEGAYLRNETPWDKGEAAPGLIDFLAAFPDRRRGPVLVPGCGLGHDARAWADSGHRVVGLDLAPTALDRAAAIAGKGAVRFSPGDFLRADQHGYAWLFEHTLFCAIDPGERDRYVRAAAAAVGVGGDFLAIHYLEPKDPAEPPWGVGRGEILERFSPWFELRAEWVPRSFAGRAGRERLFWWRRNRRIRNGSGQGKQL